MRLLVKFRHVQQSKTSYADMASCPCKKSFAVLKTSNVSSFLKLPFPLLNGG